MIASHFLVGLWFHTFDADGVLGNQGEVRAVDGDLVLVQLYDWIGGDPSKMEIRSKSEMVGAGYRFYGSNEDMHRAYSHYMAAQPGRAK